MRRVELRCACPAGASQPDPLDHEIGAPRHSVRRDDVEAEIQRLRFYACGHTHLHDDARDPLKSFLAATSGRKVDDALGQCQFVHLGISMAGRLGKS